MQPRERYLLLGPEPFSDLELVALILGTGVEGRPVRAIAADLLEKFGSAQRMADAHVTALAEIHGVGEVRAIRLHAALHFAFRFTRVLPSEVAPVRGAPDAAAWFMPSLRYLDHEELHALYLDRRGVPRHYRRVSSGSDSATIVDARQILRPAVEVGAATVIVAHNHPSGDVEPSTVDIQVTRQLQTAALLLGVSLLDHLIIGPVTWTSLAERGHLDPERPRPRFTGGFSPAAA